MKSTHSCCQGSAERPCSFPTLDCDGETDMRNESHQARWQNVHIKKGENEVSWFQENPAPSLELIAEVGGAPSSAVIDKGSPPSRLVDHLIDRGFDDVTVLDLSEAALGGGQGAAWEPRCPGSLDRRGRRPAWEPQKAYDIWHGSGCVPLSQRGPSSRKTPWREGRGSPSQRLPTAHPSDAGAHGIAARALWPSMAVASGCRQRTLSLSLVVGGMLTTLLVSCCSFFPCSIPISLRKA